MYILSVTVEQAACSLERDTASAPSLSNLNHTAGAVATEQVLMPFTIPGIELCTNEWFYEVKLVQGSDLVSLPDGFTFNPLPMLLRVSVNEPGKYRLALVATLSEVGWTY